MDGNKLLNTVKHYLYWVFKFDAIR